MNWILKNKKFPCGFGSFFSNIKKRNTSRRRKIKALLISLVLVCIFFPQVSFAAGNVFTKWLADNTIGALLNQVQGLMIFLVATATTIFSVAIDPNNISGPNGILNNSVVEDTWKTVRDTLNIFFILILLFSAFCTIFQVEKWNLKKIWLNILINALLVNFSYPIARFFIDISNVAMYYFVNNAFGKTITGSQVFTSFASYSELTKILNPKDFAELPVTYELMMIIFTFILGITFLVIAILFVVRLIALTVLVMFSPIGFVGYIFPSASSLADKWWKELFSYSFFGPIMIFTIAIASNILKAMQDNKSPFSTFANNNAGPDKASYIASAAMFSVPIVVLWMGMSVAKSLGVAGADTVVGKAQGWAKNAGSWAAKAPWRATKSAANATGIPGGIKKGWEDVRKSGKIFGKGGKLTEFALKSGKDSREAGFGGLLSGGKGGWAKEREKKKLAEFNERVNKSKDDHIGMNINDLNTALSKPAEATTAVTQAAQYRHFISDPIRKDELKESIKKEHATTLASLGSEKKKQAFIKEKFTEKILTYRKNNTDAQNFYVKGKSGRTATAAPASHSANNTFTGGGGI